MKIQQGNEVVEWTLSKVKRFKKALDLAWQNGSQESVFKFDGHEYVVGYAKYLYEYLKEKIK